MTFRRWIEVARVVIFLALCGMYIGLGLELDRLWPSQRDLWIVLAVAACYGSVWSFIRDRWERQGQSK